MEKSKLSCNVCIMRNKDFEQYILPVINDSVTFSKFIKDATIYKNKNIVTIYWNWYNWDDNTHVIQLFNSLITNLPYRWLKIGEQPWEIEFDETFSDFDIPQEEKDIAENSATILQKILLKNAGEILVL